MKRCSLAFAAPLILMIGMAGHALADLASLRGAVAVPTTESAPELQKFINDKENIERNFKQQPPLVPHVNERYVINLKENECLECHMKQPGKDKAKSVEMGESHFTDRDGNKLDHLSGSRYFCTQCHVPQIDVEPLVGSNFRSVSTK